MNQVSIVGRLGRDPELRETTAGSVCTLSVATTERRKQGDEWVDGTEWHRVVLWGRQAENAARFLQKGRQVGIIGSLRTKEWTDKDGNRRFTTEIIGRECEWLGSRGDPAPVARPTATVDLKDIPF